MNLFTYLESLPPSRLAQLYESSWTCQAVLRSLPPIAKAYVMRLLLVDQAISAGILASWVQPQHQPKHTIAMKKLKALQVLQTADDASFLLNPLFASQLRAAITGGIVRSVEVVPQHVLETAPSPAQLDAFAKSQWEALLLFLLGPDGGGRRAPAPPGMPRELVRLGLLSPPCLARTRSTTQTAVPPLDIPALLTQAGFLAYQGAQHPTATPAGLRFLLLDTYQQLWALLRQYMGSTLQGPEGSLSGAVSFLLQLGFRATGRPWALDSIPPEYHTIAGHMAQLGLLMPFTPPPSEQGPPAGLHLCATPPAAVLAGAGAAASALERRDGFIIVETNYKVFAFTTSLLHRRLLQLFVRTETLLPGLFVGALTRAAASSALERGITAEQMIEYLATHPHKQVAGRSPIVPEVVSDQLRLWERETQRVGGQPAVLYQSFELPEYFTRCVEFAKEQGTWVFDDDRDTLIARQDGHEAMKALIKGMKQG